MAGVAAWNLAVEEGLCPSLSHTTDREGRVLGRSIYVYPSGRQKRLIRRLEAAGFHSAGVRRLSLWILDLSEEEYQLIREKELLK